MSCIQIAVCGGASLLAHALALPVAVSGVTLIIRRDDDP